MEGHTNNVSFAVFHPSPPLIVSGSEDGTIKIWNSGTYRLDNTLSYALERAWYIVIRPQGSEAAVGYNKDVVVVNSAGTSLPSAWIRQENWCTPVSRKSCPPISKALRTTRRLRDKAPRFPCVSLALRKYLRHRFNTLLTGASSPWSETESTSFTPRWPGETKRSAAVLRSHGQLIPTRTLC